MFADNEAPLPCRPLRSIDFIVCLIKKFLLLIELVINSWKSANRYVRAQFLRHFLHIPFASLMKFWTRLRPRPLDRENSAAKGREMRLKQFAFALTGRCLRPATKRSKIS